MSDFQCYLFNFVRQGTGMDTNPNDADVIILSDDEDEAPGNDLSCNDSSVCIVEREDPKEPGNIRVYFSRPPASVVLCDSDLCFRLCSCPHRFGGRPGGYVLPSC